MIFLYLIYDLIKFIRYNITDPYFYIDKLLKEEIEYDIQHNELFLLFNPPYRERHFKYEKAINYNFKIIDA
jgi:hypothetical protein